MDNMVRVISENGGIVVCAVDSTAIVQKMESVHETSAVVSAALGRLLTAASLMGSWLKHEEDSLTLRVDGGGAAGPVLAVSDGEGHVRGYASRPVVEIPLRADGKLDVGTAVGRNGTLTVIRDIGLKEPYVGRVPLASGEVAEDITAYYAASEQTPSVCALGVLVDRDLSIKRAGGYLLQLLPGASEEEIDLLERNVAGMRTVTELLEEGKTPLEIAQSLLDGFFPQLLEQRTVEYRCHCSEARTADILASLGREELRSMLEKDKDAEVECHFCGRKYHFDLAKFIENLE